MRVLHFLAERGFSGGEVQLRYLIAHLHRQGHDNHLVLAPGAEFRSVADEFDLPVVEADLRRPWSPRTWRTVRGAVTDVQPDVAHFGCGRSMLWAGLFVRNLDIPLRITSRRIDYPISRSWFRGGRYRQLVDHVVANSVGVQRAVLAAGVPEERVSLIHEGIEMAPWDGVLDRRAEARDRLGLSADAIVLSCPATLRPRKGQRLLISALHRCAQQFPTAVLVLAGTGSDRSALERMARRLGLEDRVRLPGSVRPVADLYAASDIVCMDSYHEGLSNACLEASAAGLPLIVSQAGGLPEIVEDGVTGAVVPCGDVDALTAAFVRYLGDGDLRRRAGAAGAQRTRSLFTEQQMAEKMEALFLRLLSARDVRGSQT